MPKTAAAPRLTVAARDQHLSAGPAARVDDDLLRDGAQPASRIGLDLIAHRLRARRSKLDLRIESVSEGVLVTGTVSAPTSGECARCSDPITGDVEIDLTELFAYPDSATDETTEADEIRPRRLEATPSTWSSRSSTRSGWRCPSAAVRARLPRGCALQCGTRRWPTAEPGPPPRPDRSAVGQARDGDCGRRRGRAVTRSGAAAQGVGRRPARRTADHGADHTAATPTRTAGCPPTSVWSSSATRCSDSTITEELYHRHPDRSEGDLAKLRASIVNTPGAGRGRAGICPTTGWAPTLLLGKGEEHSGGADKSSILADGVESLLGAIYLEHGIDRGARGDPAAVQLAAGHGADAGCRPGLEEQPAGADRVARHWACAVVCR